MGSTVSSKMFSVRRRRVVLAAAARAVLEAVEPRRFLSATVSGVVYSDVNENGVRDAGEPGYAPRTVFADYNYNGLIDAGEPSVQTAADGTYTLGGIKSDGTSVGVRLLDTRSTAVTAPGAGIYGARYYGTDVRGNYDFGLVLRPISGRTFTDANANNKLDPGEAGMAGVRVYYDVNGSGKYDAGEPSVLSDASGNYAFYFPIDGRYTVRVTLDGTDRQAQAASYNRTAGNDGYTFTMPRAGVPDSNFGFYPVPPNTNATAVVSGNVFTDANKDGTRQSGEAAVGGQVVFADYNNNGTLDAATEPSATTDAGGNYTLRGVLSNSSSVAVRLAGVAASSVVKPSGGVYWARYNPGDNRSGLNFALVAGTTPPPPPADPGANTITLRPYYDTNSDSSASGETTGPTGATVWLDLNRNDVRESNEPLLAAATADANGIPSYAVSNVAAGSYRVAVRLPGDADSYADYRVETSSSASGPVYAYLAIPTKTAVSGVVFDDANGNGVRDNGEAGLSGVKVFNDYDFDGQIDPGEPSATTAADGSYRVAGIRTDSVPGRLSLTNLPAGSTVTAPAGGYYQARYDRAYEITGRDFGVKPSTSPAPTVSGRLFADANNNGSFDAGEAPMSGVRVFADYNGDTYIDTANEDYTTTASDGTYTLGARYGTFDVRFEDAYAAHAYVLRTAQPPKVTLTSSSPTAAHVDMPLVQSGDVYYSARADLNGNGTVDPGENWGSGAGEAFVDVNRNGAFDAGEQMPWSYPFGDYSLGDAGIRMAPGTWSIGYVLGGYEPVVGQKAVVTRDVTVVSGQSQFLGLPTPPAYPGVTGTVYLDDNEDGVRQSGERGASVLVYADLNNNGKLDVSDDYVLSYQHGSYNNNDANSSDGTYYMTFAAPGTYTLRVYYNDPTELYLPTRPGSWTVTVGGTQTLFGRDFGMPPARQVATVAGYVWGDTDKDGIFDSNESGLANRTVFADYDNDNVLDSNEPSVATDANGYYRLHNVRADYSSVPVRLLNVPASSVTRPAGGAYWGRYNYGNVKEDLWFGVIA